jgi:hypothetical protein
MKLEAMDVALVDRLVKMHIKLYLTGTGPVDSQSKLASQGKKGGRQALSGAGSNDDPITIER